VFFFFSSRRRHTRFSRNWSSDVCSSDLAGLGNDLFEFRSKIFKNYNSFYFRILKLILHLMSRIQWIGGNQYQTGLEAGIRSDGKIGRASCRESVEITGLAVARQEQRRRH